MQQQSRFTYSDSDLACAIDHTKNDVHFCGGQGSCLGLPPPPQSQDCMMLKWALYVCAADKQVYPRLDVMGWYATGEQVEPQHMDINKVVSSRP